MQIVLHINILRIHHHWYNLSHVNRHLSCLHFYYYNNAITNILVFTHLLKYSPIFTDLSMCDILWERLGIHIWIISLALWNLQSSSRYTENKWGSEYIITSCDKCYRGNKVCWCKVSWELTSTAEPGKNFLRSWHLNWDPEVVEYFEHREEHCKVLDGKELGIFKELKRASVAKRWQKREWHEITLER